MKTARLACDDERRRQLIRDRKLNGVDYVDVAGTHLCVHFLTGIPKEFLPGKKGNRLTPEERTAALAHLVVSGGRRVRDLRVVDVAPGEPPSKYEQACLDVELDKEGDWSSYRLCFVETEHGQPTETPLKSLDPRYACVDFVFKNDCPAEIDCKAEYACEPEERPTPPISYLAKDYATFRQLMLDRLALIMPGWRERHVPDIGIALVELLAYTADHLSYFQDAVITEQYLGTARQRISVRRHARLVDYTMHDGCNARAFLEVQAAGDGELDPRGVYFITRTPEVPPVLRASQLERLPEAWLVFEPVTEQKAIGLRLAHNLIRIYTWGDEQCCLSQGATHATLLDELEEHDQADPKLCDERPWPPVDHHHDEHCRCGQEPPPEPQSPRPLELKAGDFLLFEELACAGSAYNSTTPGDGGFDGKTPQPDVDRTHRHVVRLTRVTKACDALRGNRLLEVDWCREDALPFPLCLSAIGTAPECDLVRGIAVARGNIVLVDHGATITDEGLPTVPPRVTREVCEEQDVLAEVPRVAARYRPRLKRGPLTLAQPIPAGACATTVLRQDPRAARPALSLAAIPPGADGETPLFTATQLSDLVQFAKALAPADGPLRSLRRRLSAEVRTLLDGGKVTEPLLTALAVSLRALTEAWLARGDLLSSDADDPHFVAEIDDDGVAHLRFGDGDCGRALEPGMAFLASYRVGNGRAGLVGAESIVHAVFRQGVNEIVSSVRNPLPSAGAVDPEPVGEVKQFAPGAFRKELGRAVTAEDYATLAQYLRFPERDPRIQRAAGALTWTGSWYEADVAVDPLGTPDLAASLRWSVIHRLRRYRRMGHDLRVEAADAVPLRLELDLCVQADHLRAHVLAAVRAALGNRALSGGQRGFFHPDNLSFGEAVYVSRIVAAVMAVEGVSDVKVLRLERLGRRKDRNPDLPKGLLKLRPNEVARLDNDPAMPENGILVFRRVRGGR